MNVQVYKQKVKHLLYEQQNNISTLKADGELGLKLAGEEAAKREAELQKDCRNLNLQLKEQVRQACTNSKNRYPSLYRHKDQVLKPVSSQRTGTRAYIDSKNRYSKPVLATASLHRCVLWCGSAQLCMGSCPCGVYVGPRRVSESEALLYPSWECRLSCIVLLDVAELHFLRSPELKVLQV